MKNIFIYFFKGLKKIIYPKSKDALIKLSLFLLCSGFLFFLCTYKFWLVQIGKYLIYQTEIKSADAIVVLGGGKNERVVQGIKLLKAKYADKLIFTGEKEEVPFLKKFHWAELAKKEAILQGVSEENIITELRSHSTYDDAVLVQLIVQEYGFKSIIIVSEPYHMKRAYFTFRKRFRNSGVKLMFYPVQDSVFSAHQWWISEESLVRVNNEYIKIVYYFSKGYI